MNKFLIVLLTLLFNIQQAQAFSIDTFMDKKVAPVSDAIAAVILGGTSLSGGVGFVLPTVVGAMIMGIIDNILTLMNVNPHATNIVKGAVILIAVLVDKKVKDLSAKAE